MRTLIFSCCLILGFSIQLHADNKCLQGDPKKDHIDKFLSNFKGSKSRDLAGMYQSHTRAANSISNLYSEVESKGGDGLEAIRPLVKRLNADEDVEKCATDNVDQNIHRLKRVIALSEIPVIRKSCIRASMMREHGNTEFMCNSSTGSQKDLGTPGNSGSCLTEQIVDYTWWAFHKAIYCLSDPAKPIDPMMIFLKMNNESTFHMQVASRGGKGIGQLTTSAIAQVKQSGRLQKVLNSTNPNCTPFKQALKEAQPADAKGNACLLIEPNDGLARNLIYSISYYLETRDNLLNNFGGSKKNSINYALKSAGIEDARFYNLAALASYGPEGSSVQSELKDAFKASGNNYSRFRTEVINRIPYVSNIANKADEAVDGAENGVKKLTDCYDPMTATSK